MEPILNVKNFEKRENGNSSVYLIKCVDSDSFPNSLKFTVPKTACFLSEESIVFSAYYWKTSKENLKLILLHCWKEGKLLGPKSRAPIKNIFLYSVVFFYLKRFTHIWKTFLKECVKNLKKCRTTRIELYDNMTAQSNLSRHQWAPFFPFQEFLITIDLNNFLTPLFEKVARANIEISCFIKTSSKTITWNSWAWGEEANTSTWF